MKSWLVDVPVRVNIWIRPECQKAQFEVLRKARPSIMFLVSDGGRNEKEWAAIRHNRELFDKEIDWECTVYKLYEDHNNGLYTMSKKGSELIWSKVDRCVFLEDDYIPSVSFFAFCAELLEKYKDDERIEAICGMNHCGKWEQATADYFFSDVGSIWGQAYWKRCYMQRDPEHTYGKDPYVMDLLKQNTMGDKHMWKAIHGYANDPLYSNHIAGGEFYHRLAVTSQHSLFIIPKYNMICNIGCTADGAHASEYKLMPRGIRQVFNMKTYELDGPLKHMNYVIPDREYTRKRNRILGRNPYVGFYRRLEGILLAIRYKGLAGIAAKIKSYIARKKKIET